MRFYVSSERVGLLGAQKLVPAFLMWKALEMSWRVYPWGVRPCGQGGWGRGGRAEAPLRWACAADPQALTQLAVGPHCVDGLPFLLPSGASRHLTPSSQNGSAPLSATSVHADPWFPVPETSWSSPRLPLGLLSATCPQLSCQATRSKGRWLAGNRPSLGERPTPVPSGRAQREVV